MKVRQFCLENLKGQIRLVAMKQNPFPVLLFWHFVFTEGSYFNDHSHCQQCLLVTYMEERVVL